MKVRIENRCPLARKHHDQSKRQFAHVFHKQNTICLTPEFYDLPKSYQLGILLHELGHLAIGPKDHSESDADAMAFTMTGVTIKRRAYDGMHNLECIRKKDWLNVLDFLRDNLA